MFSKSYDLSELKLWIYALFGLCLFTIGGFVYLLDGDNLLPKIARRSGNELIFFFKLVIASCSLWLSLIFVKVPFV